MADITVVIDTGKANTKGIIEIHNEIFEEIMPTRVELANGKSDLGETVIVYKGQEYFVGRGDYNSNVTLNQTKLLEEHKICAYTMIAKLFKKANVKASGQKIDLIINIPMVEYLDQVNRNKYTEFFKDKTDIEISVAKEEYRFSIENVYGEFECGGALVKVADKHFKDTIVVVDNGGKNTTYCQFIDLKPQREFCGSLLIGGNNIISKVRIHLQGLVGLDFGDTRIERIVTGKDRSTLNESEQIDIDNIVKKQLKKVMIELKLTGIDIDRTQIVLTGGTSLLYEPYLEEYLPNKNYYITENPIFDNVKGWLQKHKLRKDKI